MALIHSRHKLGWVQLPTVPELFSRCVCFFPGAKFETYEVAHPKVIQQMARNMFPCSSLRNRLLHTIQMSRWLFLIWGTDEVPTDVKDLVSPHVVGSFLPLPSSLPLKQTPRRHSEIRSPGQLTFSKVWEPPSAVWDIWHLQRTGQKTMRVSFGRESTDLLKGGLAGLPVEVGKTCWISIINSALSTKQRLNSSCWSNQSDCSWIRYLFSKEVPSGNLT